jgi:hypothetical protein
MLGRMIATDGIKRRFELLAPALDERTRRLVATAEALAVGWGGGTAVARATGVSRRAIREGIRELSEPRASASRPVRRARAGRNTAVAKDPTLLHDLGYRLQANRKVREGGDHPDRDAQFGRNRDLRGREHPPLVDRHGTP